MGIHDKQNVLRSVDTLIYYYFVYIYFLDASLLLLFFRIFLQLPLITSRALPRSSRTATGIITAELGLCILIHANSEPGRPGVLIDFVGSQSSQMSISRLIWLDLIIYVLQMIRIFMNFHISLGNNNLIVTAPVPPAFASAFGTEILTIMLSTPSPNNDPRHQNSSESDDPFYHSEDLTLDVGLETSLRSIIHAPPPPPQQDSIERLPA